jgi:hypothetical protein
MMTAVQDLALHIRDGIHAGIHHLHKENSHVKVKKQVAVLMPWLSEESPVMLPGINTR